MVWSTSIIQSKQSYSTDAAHLVQGQHPTTSSKSRTRRLKRPWPQKTWSTGLPVSVAQGENNQKLISLLYQIHWGWKQNGIINIFILWVGIKRSKTLCLRQGHVIEKIIQRRGHVIESRHGILVPYYWCSSGACTIKIWIRTYSRT